MVALAGCGQDLDLGVSVRLFLDEISTFISRQSQAMALSDVGGPRPTVEGPTATKA